MRSDRKPFQGRVTTMRQSGRTARGSSSPTGVMTLSATEPMLTARLSTSRAARRQVTLWMTVTMSLITRMSAWSGNSRQVRKTRRKRPSSATGNIPHPRLRWLSLTGRSMPRDSTLLTMTGGPSFGQTVSLNTLRTVRLTRWRTASIPMARMYMSVDMCSRPATSRVALPPSGKTVWLRALQAAAR